MTIHVVSPGETVDSIAAGYGVAPKQLAADNELPPDYALAVGQTLVVRFPRAVHVVAAGETLTSIAAQYGTTVRQLWRNNWALGGAEALTAGQLLVVSYFGEKIGEGVFNGYAYPFISPDLLAEQLPYLSTMAPFTYGITAEGGLLPLDDEAMLEAARERGTKPVMHLSTLTEAGQFDTGRAEFILTDYEAQGRLAAEVLQTVLRKDFAGLDVETGIVTTQGADLLEHRFLRHPTTGLTIPGFQVPQWEAVRETVESAVKLTPNAVIVGWDVAITTDGPVLIEGNAYPSVQIMQTAGMEGLKRLWNSALKR